MVSSRKDRTTIRGPCSRTCSKRCRGTSAKSRRNTSACAVVGDRRRVMATMSMVQALNSAIDVMLARDPNVLVFGEDVGFFGGVFRCTDGLQQRYGDRRVFDAPIAEGGLIAVAVGMGAYG